MVVIWHYYRLFLHLLETKVPFIILSMQSELMVEVILLKISWEVYRQHSVSFLGVMKRLSK